MKINQLFIKQVDMDLVLRLLTCFGLKDLNDKRMFCKYDLESIGTVKQIESMMDEISEYYLPCKAKVYLTDLTEKKSLTILKQIIRLHGYFLKSKEKTFNNRKVMFYTLISEKDKKQDIRMKTIQKYSLIEFN
jgi:hypothetical protein